MKTTPEALKALYKALGGDEDDVASLNTSVEVLNKIAVLLGGSGGALTIPDAIDAITANAKPYPVLVEKNVTANGTYNPEDDEADGYSKVTVAVTPTLVTKEVTANGTYNASSDNADGYSSVVVTVE